MIVRVQVHVWFPYWRHIHFRNRVPVRNYFRDWFDFHACLLYEESELVRGELVLGNPPWRWTGCCYVLGGGGCAFVLVYLEARHHLIYACVGVVEAQQYGWLCHSRECRSLGMDGNVFMIVEQGGWF